MNEYRRHISRLFAVIVMAAPGAVLAQSIESLVMPGDVAKAHVEIETECNACHKRFDRAAQRQLCLDCHEDVAADLSTAAGFHGKSPTVGDEQCSVCHTDHEGRKADIVGLDPVSFDHAFTDFELSGKHGEAECGACHAAAEKHRDAPAECFDCHAEDDVHRGFLGEDCASCHVPAGWEDVEFDHEVTGYSLIGKHLDAECLDCHADETHQNTPTTCFGCHADNDVHEGRSGEQCDNCHNPLGWDDTSFDHARDTTFDLIGRHAELVCGDCHSDEPFGDNLQTGCVSCHREDDEHKGHNGDDCNGCHSSERWDHIRFDHDRDTNFLLLGAHVEVGCVDCHVEPVFEQSPGDQCNSCHLDDDPHKGSLGEQCADCHEQGAWDPAPFFDHSLTKFPLLGEHANAECEACHETHAFAETDSACGSCHLEDDVHGDSFDDNCGYCHNPVAWDLWLFDHNTQTEYELRGAHTDVSCADCHRQPLSSLKHEAHRCGDCHRNDDIHDGEFGFDCGRCHDVSSFKDVRSLQ